MSNPPIPNLSSVASPPRRCISYTDLQTVDDPIGAGGNAVVYEATLSDSTPPDRIALKEPPTDLSTLNRDIVQQFHNEAETWETLDRYEREKPRWTNSEHIVGIIETGDDLPWIAMEYMDGGSLQDKLNQQPEGLPLSEALWVGECICRGIELAHNYGIAHLDLKPANVLFRETSGDTWDVPKLADWGLARLLANETGTSDGLSIEYAAPEQFEPDEFGDPDTLTDLYQAGAIVYALLTGEPPYEGSQTSIMYDVVHGDGPTPPSSVREECPPELDRALGVALARQKTDRYRTINEFEEALKAIRIELSTKRPTIPELGASQRVNRAISTETKASKARQQDTNATIESGDMWNWPMFQGNPARTGSRPDVSFSPTDLLLNWQFVAEGEVNSSPAVVNGVVYVGDSSGRLYAIDAGDGKKLWEFETIGSVHSSPAVVDDTVYFGGGHLSENDHHVYAINANNGDKRWCTKTNGNVLTSPVVTGETVFAGCSDGRVYALNETDGTTRWTYDMPSDIKGSLAIKDSTVYVGSRHGTSAYENFVALHASNGEERWAIQPSSYEHISTTPVVAEETVYICSEDGTVHARDAADGSEQWSKNIGDRIESSSPAISNGTVFVGSFEYPVGDSSHIHALDANDGEEKWKFTTGADKLLSSPAILGGTVYVGGMDGILYVLDAKSGEEHYRFQFEDDCGGVRYMWSSPAVVNNSVYIGATGWTRQDDYHDCGYVFSLSDDISDNK